MLYRVKNRIDAATEEDDIESTEWKHAAPGYLHVVW